MSLQIQESKSFGGTLKAWREHMETKHQAIALAAQGRSRFTQQDAADYLGVSKRTYEDWEYDRRTPVPFTMRVLLRKIKGTYTIRRRRRYV